MSYIAVIDKGTSGEWRGPIAQYERVMHEWETSERIVLTTQEGAELTIRASEVIAVQYVSDASEARITARKRQEKLERE